MMKKQSSAFTLIEVLISLVILTVIATIGLVSLSRYRYLNELDLETEKLANYLRQARNRAINGEEGLNWGVRLVNNQTNPHYYFLFKGDDYNNPLETIYLSSRIQFLDPSNGNFKDLIFQRATGYHLATSTIILALRNDQNISKTITVNYYGLINY